MSAPAPTVKAAPAGTPEVREGRAPALCEACGGHHGPVNVYIRCLVGALLGSRARVAELEAQLATTTDDAERGRKAREAVEDFARMPGGRRANTKDGRP